MAHPLEAIGLSVRVGSAPAAPSPVVEDPAEVEVAPEPPEVAALVVVDGPVVEVVATLEVVVVSPVVPESPGGAADGM